MEKLTLAAKEVGPDDIELLRGAGLSRPAIKDVIYVCALFNIVDRVADALGFAMPSGEDLTRQAAYLLKRGYKV